MSGAEVAAAAERSVRRFIVCVMTNRGTQQNQLSGRIAILLSPFPNRTHCKVKHASNLRISERWKRREDQRFRVDFLIGNLSPVGRWFCCKNPRILLLHNLPISNSSYRTHRTYYLLTLQLGRYWANSQAFCDERRRYGGWDQTLVTSLPVPSIRWWVRKFSLLDHHRHREIPGIYQTMHRASFGVSGLHNDLPRRQHNLGFPRYHQARDRLEFHSPLQRRYSAFWQDKTCVPWLNWSSDHKSVPMPLNV